MSAPAVDAKTIRCALKLTQQQFAQRFSLNLATLRQWEQGRREPDMAAKVLLTVIGTAPEVVDAALKSVA